MSFVNTVSLVGDKAVFDSIVDSSITELSDRHITAVKSYAFRDCAELGSVILPKVTIVNEGVFNGCYDLTSVELPTATQLGSYAFRYCSKLTVADFPEVTGVKSYAFDKCSKLKSMILRNQALCTLSNVNALGNTPIAAGTGYIYVPAALVDEYKSATNWATYAAQFRALEDYTVDGTATGALDETKI